MGAAVLGLGAGLLSGVGTPEASAAPQSLNWEACAPIHGASPETRCATVQVPRDYSDPDGPTIEVTVSRLAATNPAGKRGVLIGNPGGPGGDAVGMFSVMQTPASIRSEWDLVAVQPRGLLSSTPVDCAPVKETDDVFAAGKVNRDRCDERQPGYGKTLTTENTARDIEQVRRALGEDKVSLLGISYGTWLMSTYATLYPQHTEHLILDSAMDPARAWGDLLMEQTPGYRARVHEMMAWIAQRDDIYHLGKTPLAVYRSWSAQVEREAGVPSSLSAPPARIGDVPPGLRAVAAQYLAGVNLTADVRARFENFIATMMTPDAVQANSTLLIMTRALAPDRNYWPMVALRANGTLTENPTPNPETIKATTNFVDMQGLIMCNENRTPDNPLLTPAAFVQAFVTGDVFDSPGLLFKSGMNCAGAPPITAPAKVSNRGLAVTPLQIQSTGDPQTPYGASMALKNSMGAHLITVGGGDHGQFGRANGPLDAAMTEYLRTGRTAMTGVGQAPITQPLDRAPVMPGGAAGIGALNR